jgi:hypothetical protein
VLIRALGSAAVLFASTANAVAGKMREAFTRS